MLSEFIHATSVSLGEGAVLLRGASGTGKSALALALMAHQHHRGEYAALIGDDRIWLQEEEGRVRACGSPQQAGLCELRFYGLVRVPHQLSGPVCLVVDLGPHASPLPRLPEREDLFTCLCGVNIPRLKIERGAGVDYNVFLIITSFGYVLRGVWEECATGAY